MAPVRAPRHLGRHELRVGDQQGRSLRGIALKLGSVAVFTAMGALIKATAPQVPSGEAVFFRSFFAILPILAIFVLAQKYFVRSLAGLGK